MLQEKKLRDKCKQEDGIVSAASLWTNDILPNWETMYVLLHMFRHHFFVYFAFIVEGMSKVCGRFGIIENPLSAVQTIFISL